MEISDPSTSKAQPQSSSWIIYLQIFRVMLPRTGYPTHAPLPMAVATNEQRPYNYPTLYSIVGRSLSGRTFNLATWNVRTTNDSDNSVRPERAGVGFAVFNKLENITPQPINDRLMTCRIDLHNGNFLTLINAYAPTMQRTV